VEVAAVGELFARAAQLLGSNWNQKLEEKLELKLEVKLQRLAVGDQEATKLRAGN